MKHKHAKLIKAWADGAQIERKGLVEGLWHWETVPQWNPEEEYRLKPKQPIMRWLWVYKCSLSQEWGISTKFFTDLEAAKNLQDVQHIKLDYTGMEFPE